MQFLVVCFIILKFHLLEVGDLILGVLILELGAEMENIMLFLAWCLGPSKYLVVGNILNSERYAALS